MNEDEGKAVFAFKVNRATVKVNCADIVFFEVYGHYITMHMKDKTTYTFRGRLYDIESVLNENGFVRVHRGFAVNLSYVKRIRCTAVFLGQEWGSVPLSQKYRARVYNSLTI